MGLQVTQFINGRWRQNCYLIAGDRGDALMVDPGSQAQDIVDLVTRNHWRVHAILNTHGHYDHVGAVSPLKESYGAPFYLHRADGDLLKRANLYRMLFESREAIRVPAIDRDISGLPAAFEVGPFSLSWIATPGHTPGQRLPAAGRVPVFGRYFDAQCHRPDGPARRRPAAIARVRSKAAGTAWRDGGLRRTRSAEYARRRSSPRTPAVWRLLQ